MDLDRDAGPELIASILNTAASMQMLEDELDRISIHSSPAGSQPSNSRESLRSSSKYDSAFDSHYSEDTLSQTSQALAASCHVEASVLPSMILTPPLPYRVVTASKGAKETNAGDGRQSPYNYQDYIEKKFRAKRISKDPIYLENATANDQHSPSSSSPSFTLQHTQQPPTLPAVHQLEYVSPAHSSSPASQVVRNGVMDEATLPLPKGEMAPSRTDTILVSSATPPTGSHSQASPKAEDATTFSRHQSSESSSVSDELVSNDSTPTMQRKHPHVEDHTPLTPTVTIVYPQPHSSEFGQKYPPESPLPKHTYFPKTGTLFYQESITPQASPLHKTLTHKTPSSLPPRYRDSLRDPHQQDRNLPKRSGSILQRLKRKRGSFKEEGVLKRRLPVKRSFSDRLTYHIKKGWIDYEEDLELISNPTHPRQIGRMIDKKAGKFHMVQLYKPASGRYGIYISQNGHEMGVFISRFADSTAEKFYSGLIRPGDQIIRVNGKNIKEQSVDDVYDMMTESNSVIFTVIPVNSRPDW